MTTLLAGASGSSACVMCELRHFESKPLSW